MQYLLKSSASWSYDHEIVAKGDLLNYAGLFTEVHVINDHLGEIILTETTLFLTGDADQDIPLTTIGQIFLGFDEICPQTAFKNFGTFWQPLRLVFSTGRSEETIYLIINQHMLTADNQLWFDTLKELLGP